MRMLSIEVSLAWLISKSAHTRADRRLYEIENMLAHLARLHRPIDVLAEVRMTIATSDELYAWVTEHEEPFGELITRLEQYSQIEVLTTDLRDGWIALFLA
jgi:hypothetical protein